MLTTTMMVTAPVHSLTVNGIKLPTVNKS